MSLLAWGFRSAAVLVTACFVVPAQAAAVGGWLPPVEVTESNAVDPKVGVSPQGEAIVVWGPKAPSSSEAGEGGVGGVIRGASGVFGPPQAIGPGGSIIPDLAIGAGGHAGVAWYGGATARTRGGPFLPPREIAGGFPAIAVDGRGTAHALVHTPNFNPGGTATLGVAELRPDGGVGPVREVARQQWIGGPSLATGAGGRLTVAWSGAQPGESAADVRVYVATAEPGAAFGPPVLTSPPAHQNSVATPFTRTLSNARGDTLVLWPAMPPNPRPDLPDYRQDHVIMTAFRPAAGSFGVPEPVPTRDERSRGVYRWDAALGPNGEALVAWSDATSVSMAYRPPGEPFEPARPPIAYPVCCPRPGQSLPVTEHEPAVAFDPSGNGMVAYTTRSQGGAMRLQVMRRPRGGDFGAPQSAHAARDIFTPDIAMGADGGAVAVWSPQERTASSRERKDHGIYVATYDPDLAPKVVAVTVRRRTVGVEVTESGRARVAIKRKTGRRYRRVISRAAHVAPGYNAIDLSARDRDRITAPGAYITEVAVVDAAGKRSRTRRHRFRVTR